MTIHKAAHKAFDWKGGGPKGLTLFWKQFGQPGARLPAFARQYKNRSWYLCWSSVCRDAGLIEIKPEDIGALTDGPIVAVATFPDDVYWYADHQVTDPIKELQAKGSITLAFVPDVETEDRAFAEELVKFLPLSSVRVPRLGKRYATAWGHKSSLGLLYSVRKLLQEQAEKSRHPSLAVRAALTQAVYEQLRAADQVTMTSTDIVLANEPKERAQLKSSRHDTLSVLEHCCLFTQALLAGNTYAILLDDKGVPHAAFHKWLLLRFPRQHRLWKHIQLFDANGEPVDRA